MATTRRPNHRLRDLLAEAGWSGRQLATAVNQAGAENGIHLRYDRTAVAHWLAGTRPRPPAPDLIVEVLSRRANRRITLECAGLGRPGERVGAGPAGSPWEAELVAGMSVLAAQHAPGPVRRRGLMAGAAYSLGTLAVPAWVERVAHPPPPHRHGQVDGFQVHAAEQMAEVFVSGDSAFGGGHGRVALAAYLSADLAPRLGASMRPALRRRMYAVATQLTYLCGFMCFDDELHGTAQGYFRTALRLAADNDDETSYAITLRAMSVQARTLGHARPAVALAEAAVGSRRADPLHRAFLLGQLAVAHAADDDRAAALATLSAAERHLDRRSSAVSGSLIGAFHPASLAHQQATVRFLLGDRRGAIAALTVSLHHRPAAERRSRAITLARLAELQLGEGHLGEAVATWHTFLDDYPDLRSQRATSALRILRTRIRPYTGNASARALLERAAAPG